ncbi:MAG: UDP-3-O-(3-hydroxymyristoyl)glucosamine N-acyltransferase [Rickettsiales bacterium]|nr:UDP-3-O-(3-hydroxymyristoyl)glucosamine N-acyltransferase [Rickettsiales bacterium]
MADPRFFSNHGPFTLAQLCELTGATLQQGEPALEVHDVAPLDKASQKDLSFLDNVKYVQQFSASRAAAIFVHSKHVDKAPSAAALLVSDDPYRAYALAAQQFYPLPASDSAISPQAHIAENVDIAEECSIAPGAVLEAGVRIGKGCIIGANAVLHQGVHVGENTRIGACSTISHADIGSHVIIHRGVHIGQDGFGFAMSAAGHAKVPQLGRVIVQDGVEIGSGTCIDRGTGPDTVIGAGTKIDNLVQIGHNVKIGRSAVIVSQSGVSGSTTLGDGVVMAGQTGIAGHLTIGAGARVAAKAGVMRDIEPGQSVGGYPAVPEKIWKRQVIALNKLIKHRMRSK